jgi:hypothetical protein
MQKKYLFKRAADGKFIFGKTVKSVCKAGLYRIDIQDDINFVIYAVYNRDISIKYTDTFSDYLKENGVAYASMNDFIDGVSDFFDPQGIAVPTKLLTAAGAATTLQIATMGTIANLAVADFALAGSALFMLKNDGPAQVELQVKLANSADWITTKFDPGWNPEILKAVKTNASADINLKYGY